MKIRILESASEDLVEGWRFYQRQEEGLGDYFLDSLFSDIDSLQLYAGIHSVNFDKCHGPVVPKIPEHLGKSTVFPARWPSQ